jgi:peptidoglycan/xylan/chitin deacetylase (PgdA/CDA1 family)
MKRILFPLVLLVTLVSASSASAAVGDQLLFNRGLEASADSTKTAPAGWTPSWWATDNINRSTFTWSTDAHSGTHSAKVVVTGHTDGDSKWVPDPVPVSGGTYYTFSDWYKSDASTAVSVYYELAGEAGGNGHWANLFSGIAPAANWTQYKTGFTMPAGAVRAQFVHFIARDGSLQTDDYSLTEEASPPGFSHPMVSLTFDDGSKGFWDNARGPLKAKGFKTTQYIPTAGLTSANPDPFLMTRDEITTLAREGNEIGGHSVTHPLLTTVGDPQLTDELVSSKNVLEAIPGVGPVHNFAYPFGDYDARVIAAEQAAGYRSGRSVEEGYNSKLDLELYDIRVQNMTPQTTLAQFRSWVDYAKAHNYWLVIVYHEVVPDSAPRCTNTATDPDPCLGDFDTTVTSLKGQLDYISTAGLGSDVVTVQQALDTADAEMHGPVAGTVKITPAAPTTSDTVTANPSAFSDPDGDALTYQYQWKVNGVAIAGAGGQTFDLSPAGHGDSGDTITVDVSARDPKGHTSTGVSESVTIGSTATPTPDPVVIPPLTPILPTPSPTPTPAVPAPTRPAPPVATADRTAPKIVVASPTARTYKLGRTLRVKVSCTDGSGVAQCTATVRRGGGTARTVKQGTKLRLSRTGSYVLRVTAKDRSGNLASKVVRFRVVRK